MRTPRRLLRSAQAAWPIPRPSRSGAAERGRRQAAWSSRLTESIPRKYALRFPGTQCLEERVGVRSMARIVNKCDRIHDRRGGRDLRGNTYFARHNGCICRVHEPGIDFTARDIVERLTYVL